MKKYDVLLMPRREFIASASFLVLGRRLFSMYPSSSLPAQATQELKEELTPEELKLVEKSIMAQDLKNYFGKGYSCAESLLMVSLRFLGKSEDLVWLACGFGGGLYQKDLCGFLTSGVMAIGLSAGMMKEERKQKREICRELTKQYWKWWASMAPIHCAEIRKEGTSKKVCNRIGQLASAKIEGMIKPAKATL